MMSGIYRLAVQCNGWALFRIKNIELDIKGLDTNYPSAFYLVIANHQSWSDILILQHLLNRKSPVMKFLVKRELIYLPLVGLICWAYDFPFLERQSLGKPMNNRRDPRLDTDTLSKSLKRFAQSSAVIMNFAEGTRYTPEKALKQQSPYRYLLKPKAGGLNAILNIIGNRLDTVLDITLVYHTTQPSFWRFIGGGIRRVSINIETIPYRDLFSGSNGSVVQDHMAQTSEWINSQWDRKDRLVHYLKTTDTY